uniref:Uncharacterized protein n=1 Tax=Meloidogyne javanica TaxID=6303 RepID=A0A915M3N2_MELJA
MRDVRTITSNDVQQQRQTTPQSSPQQLLNYGPQSNDSSSKLSPEGPHPLTTNWNRAGGSLPNVHQMVVQQPAMGSTPPSPYNCAVNNNYCWSPSWTNVQTAAAASNQFQQQQRAARTRSPGATHFHPYRNGTSPSGGHEAKMVESGGPGGVHLQPPDPTWSKSDPAIHTNTSATNPNLIDPNFLSYPFYSEVQNSWNNETPKMFNGPATAPPTAQIQPSVLFFPSYPLGQPNMPLNQTNSIRSAPTSPTTLSSSSSMENYHPLAAIPGGKMMQGQLNNNQWSQHRHFSASPDGMEVPNICVTGTDGSLDVDCFQDLQDLHLDSETLQMLKDQADHENMVDPACETQLLS